MSDFAWNRGYVSSHPLKSSGVILALLLRYLYTLLFLYGVVHKVIHGWMWSDIVHLHFTRRLGELLALAGTSSGLDARIAAYQAAYLAHFAIPLAMPIAWIVTVGELAVGIGLLLGIATRANAAFGLFFLLNFAAGGYYNITIPPLVLMSLMMMFLPTGDWLGLDGKLKRKYPGVPWFR
jgi:thiosulfate dehydrogenase [quinone] large subunit